jgi:hypothetical protein
VPIDAVEPPPGTVPLPDRFDLPAPPGTGPLPNRFSIQLTYNDENEDDGPDAQLGCADAIDQLPEPTEAILSAHDREWAARIIRTQDFIMEDDYYGDTFEYFTDGVYNQVVKPINEELHRLARNQELLQEATTDRQRNRYARFIVIGQMAIDHQRNALATLIRDNLPMFMEHNRHIYKGFCGPRVQALPENIERAITQEDHSLLWEPLGFFASYASYATPETLARILDRVAVGIATIHMPPTFSCGASTAHFIQQLQNIRDACALIHDDPRATPPLNNFVTDLQYWRGNEFSSMEWADFKFFGAHMMRRARDRSWDRVRARFADRLASWAERYPESRLAILPAPVEICKLIASFVFPYTPYPH